MSYPGDEKFLGYGRRGQPKDDSLVVRSFAAGLLREGGIS